MAVPSARRVTLALQPSIAPWPPLDCKYLVSRFSASASFCAWFMPGGKCLLVFGDVCGVGAAANVNTTTKLVD